MENIKRIYNPIVDLSKFTSNKNILKNIVVFIYMCIYIYITYVASIIIIIIIIIKIKKHLCFNFQPIILKKNFD